MFARRFDLALDRDESGRFLPWTLSVTVYFTAMALITLIAAQTAISTWQAESGREATVEIPYSGEAGIVAQAVDSLRRQPGIGEVRPLTLDEVARLLEPWLGDPGLINQVPLPTLLSLSIADQAKVDWPAVRSALAEAAPGARIDRAEAWTAPLTRLTRLVQVYALGVIVLVLGAGIVAVIFATRSSMAIHRDTIDLLYTLGAEDRYVMRQFQRHAAWRAVLGGLIGLILAAASIAGLAALIDGLDSMLLPDTPWLTPAALVTVAVPILVAVIAAMTAGATVMRILRERP